MSSNQTEGLKEMFRLRAEYMQALRDRDPVTYPEWPLDPSVKKNQIHIKDMTLRGVEEMFEALAHLKNSKPHRKTDLPDFDRDAFIEENVDSLNYFFTVLILLGVTSEDLYAAYEKKHMKIMERIRDGY